MKEHFLLQKKTVSRANADQPFFQKKSKEDSDLKASGNDHSSVSKVESFSAPLNFNSSPIQRKENKNLPEGLQTNMENSFGRDLSNVQIHKNSQKAVDLNARAFTQGDSVHFAPNEFNPNSNEGKELIGHEFTHVIQQAEGKVEPTIHENGVAINDDKSLEKEADQMGAKMSQSQVDLSQIQDSTSSSEPSTSSMTVQAKYENTQNKLNKNGTVIQQAPPKKEEELPSSDIELTPDAEKFLADIIKVAEKTPSFWEIVNPHIKQLDAKRYKQKDKHTEWAKIDKSKTATINLNKHVTEDGFVFADKTAIYGTLLHEAMHGMGPYNEKRKEPLGNHTDMAWRGGLNTIIEGMREFDTASGTQHSDPWYEAIGSQGFPDEDVLLAGSDRGADAEKIRTNEERYEEFRKENHLLTTGKSTYNNTLGKFYGVDWDLFRSTRKSSGPTKKR